MTADADLDDEDADEADDADDESDEDADEPDDADTDLDAESEPGEVPEVAATELRAEPAPAPAPQAEPPAPPAAAVVAPEPAPAEPANPPSLFDAIEQPAAVSAPTEPAPAVAAVAETVSAAAQNVEAVALDAVMPAAPTLAEAPAAEAAPAPAAETAPVVSDDGDDDDDEEDDDGEDDEDDDEMPMPEDEGDVISDEVAAQRAGQIVNGMIQGQAPGARPQNQQRGTANQQQQGTGRRRRRRRRRGKGADGQPIQQGGQPVQGQGGQGGQSGQGGQNPQQITPRPLLRPSTPLPTNQPPRQQTPAPIPGTPAAATRTIAIADATSVAALGRPAASEAPGNAEPAAEHAPVVVAPQQPQQQPPAKPSSQRWRESTYESTSVAPERAPSNVRKVVLLNSSEPGEIRVAILENGELAEIFMERKSRGQQAGNIYKGRVVNVEPSLQAAFIDLGTERNGFLHASDSIPPDGGYNDIVGKAQPDEAPPPPSQQQQRGRNDHRNRHQNRGNHQQQNYPQQRPLIAGAPLPPEPAAIAAAPAPVAAPPAPIVHAAPVLAPVPNGPSAAVPPPQGNGNPAQPQQPQGNQQRNDFNNKRRRRRGGRGRSGRMRPPGPPPMVASSPSQGNGGNAPTETPAPATQASDVAAAPVSLPAQEMETVVPAAIAESAPLIAEGVAPITAEIIAETPVAIDPPAPTPETTDPIPAPSQPEPGPATPNDPPLPPQQDPVPAPVDPLPPATEPEPLPPLPGEPKPAHPNSPTEPMLPAVEPEPPAPADPVPPPSIPEPIHPQPIEPPSPVEPFEPEPRALSAADTQAMEAVPEWSIELATAVNSGAHAPVSADPIPVNTDPAPEVVSGPEPHVDEPHLQQDPEAPAQQVAVPTDASPEAEAEDDDDEDDEAAEPAAAESEPAARAETASDANADDDDDEDDEDEDGEEDEEGDEDDDDDASLNTGSPIPAPGQPAPVLATQQRRGGRGGGRSDRAHDRRYTIQEMLREGQEVLVQVAKEGIGQKGPALTTYISMPGRYLVLMPAVHRLGVSKRIENEEQRRALKEALSNLNPPDDMGVIVRTAGMGRSKDELQRDMDYLMRVWENLKKKARGSRAPSLIYQEGDVVTRVFRDIISDDVTEIIIDDATTMERAREFLRETSPGSEHKLKLYTDAEPLFHRHGVEQQMQRLFNRKVNLRNGGSIVIEQTEALVAIDVNTGRFREKRNQDDTILQTNLEAAREIARQLRLRDIGGLVMIDFIDMEIADHRRRVERELKGHLARDKARINVLPVSSLGVVEMTRQRVRHSLRKTLFDRCPHCSGAGHIKAPESIGLEMLREIKNQLRDQGVRRVKVLLNSSVAFAILNQFRKDLAKLEEARDITIEVCGDPAVSLSQLQVSTAKEGGEWVLKKVSEVDDYVRNS